MKKLTLLLLAVAFVATASAQKNSILKYGNAGISTHNKDFGNGFEESSFNWHINPGVGYQFTDNITVGAQGGIWSQFDQNRSSNGLGTQWNRTAVEQREWQAGAFFRYSKQLGKIFNIFTHVDLSYVSGQDITENETRAVDFTSNRVLETVIYNYDYYNGFQAFVTPAVAANVYKGFALTFSFGGLGYRTTSYDTPKAPAPLNNTIDENNFVFSFGKQASFGIQYNFKCGCKSGNVKPMDDLRPIKVSDDDE